MYKRLLILNGLSIFAVVCNHAAGFGQIGLFLWADSFHPVTVPDWSQIGSFSHYLLLVIRQAATFCVPAFFFVSGFFVCYAAQDKNKPLNWAFVRKRLITLLIPYFLWSVVLIAMDFVLGNFRSPFEYLLLIPSSGVVGPYWFVPALCYSYLLSPIIVRLVQWNWKLILIITGVIQLTPVMFNILGYFGVTTPLTTFAIRISPPWSPFYWIFFFTFGITVGFHVQGFAEWLQKYRVGLTILVLITLLLNIMESDFLLRTTLQKWGAYDGTITYNLYSTVFILWILAIRTLPLTKSLAQLSPKSYGIYLLHYPIIEFTARIVHKVFPRMLGIPIIFVPLLIVVGLGFSLLIMNAVRRSPVNQYYRFAFG